MISIVCGVSAIRCGRLSFTFGPGMVHTRVSKLNSAHSVDRILSGLVNVRGIRRSAAFVSGVPSRDAKALRSPPNALGSLPDSRGLVHRAGATWGPCRHAVFVSRGGRLARWWTEDDAPFRAFHRSQLPVVRTFGLSHFLSAENPQRFAYCKLCNILYSETLFTIKNVYTMGVQQENFPIFSRYCFRSPPNRQRSVQQLVQQSVQPYHGRATLVACRRL